MSEWIKMCLGRCVYYIDELSFTGNGDRWCVFYIDKKCFTFQNFEITYFWSRLQHLISISFSQYIFDNADETFCNTMTQRYHCESLKYQHRDKFIGKMLTLHWKFVHKFYMNIRRRSFGDVIILHWGHTFLLPCNKRNRIKLWYKQFLLYCFPT